MLLAPFARRLSLVALGGKADPKRDKATLFGLERDDFSLNHHPRSSL